MSSPALLLAPAKPSLQLRGAPGGVLVLPLPPVMRFDALRLQIRDTLGNPPGRYAGARLRLELGQRELDMMEIRRIVHMLKDEFEVEVVGLNCESAAIQRMAERELKLKISVAATVTEADAVEPLLPPSDMNTAVTEMAPLEVTATMPKPSFETESGGTDLVAPPDDEPEEDPGGRVLTLTQTVRSGTCVRYGGDVQVFGDVNPGAQVIAGGNIVVFGALKGMAHAGTRDDKAVILAFDLRPTQLRIGKVIGVVPGADPDRATRGFAPEVAYVAEEALVVEPYRGKMPAPFLTTYKPTESA